MKDNKKAEKKQEKVKILPKYRSKIEESIELIYSLSKSNNNILVTLFDFVQGSFFNKKELAVNPKMSTIAQNSEVSEKSVENFNKKIKKFSEFIKIERLFKKGRRHLNKYSFDPIFFLTLFLLKNFGGLFDKSCQQLFITKLHEDQDFINKLLTTSLEKLRHADSQKYATVITLLNYYSIIIKVLTEEVPKNNENIEINTEEITFDFKGVLIKTQQKKYFLNNYPIPVLKRAKDDMIYRQNQKEPIISQFAMYYSRVKYHNLNRTSRYGI